MRDIRDYNHQELQICVKYLFCCDQDPHFDNLNDTGKAYFKETNTLFNAFIVLLISPEENNICIFRFATRLKKKKNHTPERKQTFGSHTAC